MLRWHGSTPGRPASSRQASVLARSASLGPCAQLCTFWSQLGQLGGVWKQPCERPQPAYCPRFGTSPPVLVACCLSIKRLAAQVARLLGCLCPPAHALLSCFPVFPHPIVRPPWPLCEFIYDCLFTSPCSCCLLLAPCRAHRPHLTTLCTKDWLYSRSTDRKSVV